jgi:hypothetical protein
VITLFNFRLAVGFRDQRIFAQLNGIGFFHQRAGQRRNHHGAFGIRLGMCRIGPAQHITGILNQRMLESAAGAQERYAVFTRVARGDKGGLGVFIGAGRNQPDGIVAHQIFRAGQLRGGKPVVIGGEVKDAAASSMASGIA